MRREFWLSSLFGVLLGLCMALGAVGCLATAFELTVLDPQKLLLICLAGLCLCALMCRWRWGDLVLLVAVGAALGYLLRREEFLSQLRQLIFRISYIYDLAYGWGAVSWPGMTWDAGAADLPLLVLALLLGMSVCRSVCRGKPVMVPLMLALLPLAACLVVTDTVPGWQSLCLLLFAGVMLLLTGSVREDSPEQANRLTMMGVIPVAAALAVLFLAAPQDGYVNKTEDIRQSLRDWLQPLSQELEAGTGEGRLELTTPQPEEVDLSSLGSRDVSRKPQMYVTAQTGGSLYLRGMDYDVYDGTGWQSTGTRAETFACSGTDLGYVAVETLEQQKQMYLPYYPAEGVMLVGGRAENTGLYTQYTFRRTGLPENYGALLVEGTAEHTPDPAWLELPQGTLEGAAGWIRGLEEESTASGKAQRVGALVRDAGTYTLDAQRMPQEAEDFALWFLEEAKAGYCVHFATAAVVLLRAAGVEARYVTGYMVRLNGGETVAVTEENAHAWAEYYEPLLDAWLVLDATPASLGAAETVPEETTEPADLPRETTQPPEEETQQTTPAAPESREKGNFLWKWLLALVLTWMAAEGQRRVRLGLRRSWTRRGSPNRQGLKRWRQVQTLAALLGETPPAELRELALKAKFSQHTLTGEELLALDAYLRTGVRRLRQHPWYRRLLYRYGYALY